MTSIETRPHIQISRAGERLLLAITPNASAHNASAHNISVPESPTDVIPETLLVTLRDQRVHVGTIRLYSAEAKRALGSLVRTRLATLTTHPQSIPSRTAITWPMIRDRWRAIRSHLRGSESARLSLTPFGVREGHRRRHHYQCLAHGCPAEDMPATVPVFEMTRPALGWLTGTWNGGTFFGTPSLIVRGTPPAEVDVDVRDLSVLFDDVAVFNGVDPVCYQQLERDCDCPCAPQRGRIWLAGFRAVRAPEYLFLTKRYPEARWMAPVDPERTIILVDGDEPVAAVAPLQGCEVPPFIRAVEASR